MTTYAYTIIRASGDLERTRIPALFDPFEVAARLRHSLVFLRTPKGRTVGTKNAGFVAGPAVTLVHRDEHYLVPSDPRSDAEAFHFYRDYVEVAR
jgi:hypothetical protein